MSSKSSIGIIAVLAVGTIGNSAQADTGNSGEIDFSGSIAPTCMIASVDVNTVLPIGANPDDYVQFLCNTGEPSKLLYRGATPQSPQGLNFQFQGQFFTIVP